MKFSWDLEQWTFLALSVSHNSGFYAPLNFAPMSTTETNNNIRATFVHFDLSRRFGIERHPYTKSIDQIPCVCSMYVCVTTPPKPLNRFA